MILSNALEFETLFALQRMLDQIGHMNCPSTMCGGKRTLHGT